jgi:hypothetical protein
MAVRAACLVFHDVAEHLSDLKLAFCIGDFSEVQLASIGLALGGKRFLQIPTGFERL